MAVSALRKVSFTKQLFTALGLPLRGRWSDRKSKLMGHLHQYGTQCLIKETLDQPDTIWLQFRRRLDKLEPFCRIAGHKSCEVREILAALETVYRELFPHLNLRRWSGAIYTWLTQPVLNPTNSGRVTMDYLMKLVTTALEWSHAAGETDVKAETLEKAASLLVLRRDTLRIIDGAGPSIEALHRSPQNKGMGAGRNQNRKLCTRTFSRTRLKRWENRCKQSKHPNARFLEWFPSNSNVFSTVALRWLNVPIVQGRARSPQARESSGSRLTTNAKRMPP